MTIGKIMKLYEGPSCVDIYIRDENHDCIFYCMGNQIPIKWKATRFKRFYVEEWKESITFII